MPGVTVARTSSTQPKATAVTNSQGYYGFSANPTGKYVIKPAGNGTYALVSVDKVVEGDPSKVEKAQRDALRGQMMDAMAQAATLEYIESLKSRADIKIAQDGTVSGARGQLGKVKLVTFDNESALQKDGASLYSTTQQPKPVETPMMLQGSLEGSNVQPVLEISHMLDVMRAYQTTANLTQSQEDLKRNAIDKLGSAAN